MKRFIPNRLGRYLITLFLVLFILPIALLAQVVSDTASVVMPVVAAWQDGLVWLIPVIVPILIALTKKWLYVEQPQPDGSIVLDPPKWLPKWMLPVLAPVLGMLVSYLLYLAGAGAGSAITGALLGAVGTWLREVSKPITNARLAA